MRIIFVRHGHPNYKKDCLTELGHKQAEAAAERLKDEVISEIHASSCGRAYETAKHIAARHGLPVTKHDFMREIHWGTPDLPDDDIGNKNPWEIADWLISSGRDTMDAGWESKYPFEGNSVVKSANNAACGFDTWLNDRGYEREGCYYRVVNKRDDTILMASHAGSSSAVLSHILNIPFPFVCASMRPNFTSITVVNFYGNTGDVIAPRVEIFGDARHIEGIISDAILSR